MTLQAYIDESSDENGVFVLAGCISDAESWAAFTKEWEEVLKYGILNKHGRYHFKMSDMALNEERMSRVPLFLKIIEKYVLGFVSAKIDISELKRALSRIRITNIHINWGALSNPYYVTLRCLLDMFHLTRDQIADVIPIDEQINFIFDYRDEKKTILSIWDEYLQARPGDVKKCYGATPRFEDDEKFLPLQSADLWAWWVRKWYNEGTPEKILVGDFCEFNPKETRKHVRVEMSLNEEQLVDFIKCTLRGQINTDHIVCNVKFSLAH
jgi:hypothetical protein